MSGVAAASDALISDSTRRSTSVAKSRSPLPINAPMCERPCRSVRAPMSIACSAASSISPSRNRRPLPSRHHRTRSPPGSYRDGRAREHRADESGVASLDVGANDDRQTRVGSQAARTPGRPPGTKSGWHRSRTAHHYIQPVGTTGSDQTHAGKPTAQPDPGLARSRPADRAPQRHANARAVARERCGAPASTARRSPRSGSPCAREMHRDRWTAACPQSLRSLGPSPP